MILLHGEDRYADPKRQGRPRRDSRTLILASIVIRSHFLVTLQCEGIMVRATVIFSAVLAVISFAIPANGQQLVNRGILVTQILARTRMGICEKGDLVHVTVR